MLVEKLPDHTVSDNECIKFQKFFQNLHICPEKVDRETSSAVTAYYSNEHLESALRVIAFARQRGEMPGRAPGEAWSRRQITQNIIFGRT